jgi:acylphosphatase
MPERKNLKIKGSVQGLFFRAGAKAKADELGITGWIKNEPDGSISAEISGSAINMQKFIAWCKKGPPGARVEEVQVTDQPDSGEDYKGFSIRY